MAAEPRATVALSISAALLPTVLIAIYASHLIACWAPLGPEARWALGYYLPLPLYTVAACAVGRMGDGRRAWLVAAGAAAVLKLALLFS